jgi:hypothetical protein
MAQGTKREYLHRRIAEQALGKPLPPKAIVHHADGSKSERAALVICEDQAYHMLLHVRMRVLRAGGDPNTERICYRCQRVTPISGFKPSCIARNVWSTCKSCVRDLSRILRARRVRPKAA